MTLKETMIAKLIAMRRKMVFTMMNLASGKKLIVHTHSKVGHFILIKNGYHSIGIYSYHHKMDTMSDLESRPMI